MSLYRKYRPQTFADVVGQEPIVTTLENAVAQGKLTHAYLFAGSRGTGKTSVARILAKHILTTGIADEKLRSLLERGVVDGSLVDLIEIDGASNRRIEDSRDLVEKIQFSPVVAGAKVYIIDEVHMLTKEAFNALLKTLEEPPPYAFFILATTELQKIPATIQSRCQRFTFHHIREEDIVRRLQYIADQERITVDRTALRAIAHHAQGGMRDAISLLDQLRSLEKITIEHVQQRIGETGLEEVEQAIAAIETSNQTNIVHLIQRLEEAGTPIDTFARQLLGAIRARLHAAVEVQQPVAQYISLMDALLRAIRDIRVAPVPSLVLESALLSLCEGIPDAPPAKQRAKKREEQPPAEMERKKEPAPAVATIAEQAKERATAEAIVEAPELSLASIHAAWPDIVQRATPPALKMSLKNGRVTAVAGKTVTLTFVSNFHRERVMQQDGAHTVERLLQEHFKLPLRIECVTDEEKKLTPIADKSMVDLAEAVNEVF